MAAAPEAGLRAADALYRADRQPPGDPIPCGEPASAGGAYAGDVRRGHDAGDRRGRVPLVLELLSPAQRPLQITRDLSAFWQGSYREVQKEMKDAIRSTSGRTIRPTPPRPAAAKILVAAAAGRHPARPVGSQTLDHLLPEKNTPAGQRQPGPKASGCCSDCRVHRRCSRVHTSPLAEASNSTCGRTCQPHQRPAPPAA